MKIWQIIKSGFRIICGVPLFVCLGALFFALVLFLECFIWVFFAFGRLKQALLLFINMLDYSFEISFKMGGQNGKN